MNFIFKYFDKKKSKKIEDNLVNNVLPSLENEIKDAHKLEIKFKESTEYNIYYFDDLEALKGIILQCYQLNMDIHIDLNTSLLTVAQYIEIININPYTEDFLNLDNCQSIEEINDWLEYAWFLADIKQEAINAI